LRHHGDGRAFDFDDGFLGLAHGIKNSFTNALTVRALARRAISNNSLMPPTKPE
jgi:hypothetical protein